MSNYKGETKPSLIQKIHIAKNQLCFDDDTYRDFLVLHGSGKNSCSKMTVPELYSVFNACKDAGFKVKSKKHIKPKVAKTKQPLVDKIGALLADSKKPWSYADGIGKQMYSKQKLTWCTVVELRGIVAALEKQKKKDKNVEG